MAKWRHMMSYSLVYIDSGNGFMRQYIAWSKLIHCQLDLWKQTTVKNTIENDVLDKKDTLVQTWTYQYQ